jgi:hypothetical protein
MKTVVGTLVTSVLTSGAVSTGAQQPDMDLMTKCSSVAVIRYAVVAEYAGTPVIKN